jgi:hypothetical protein
MTGIVLSVEQINSAPPGVREWIEKQVAADLALAFRGRREPPRDVTHNSPHVVGCEVPEIVQILSRLAPEPVARQALLEFGRVPLVEIGQPPLYGVNIGDVARHAGIIQEEQLVAALNAVNAALQSLRADPTALLFGFDAGGHCYIHETSHRALHRLWLDLVSPLMTSQPMPGTDFPIAVDPPYRSAPNDGAAAQQPAPLP